MRRLLLSLAALAIAASVLPERAHAQGRDRGDDEQQRQEEESKKRKRDDEWGDRQAPLAALRNAGPCPFVKVLYDAGRYIEFKDGREAAAAVAYTGEIQGISAGCEYKGADPIKVKMNMLFELGRGPQAEGSSKTYRYWIAVTQRNTAVISKQYFDLPVKFADGQDRVYVTEEIGEITIPRAKMTTSGSNFEILVGFDVTPQMAAFNRDGKRFRANVGGAAGQDSNKQ